MQDYSISKFSRKCAISGRGLEPGEGYVSVILPSEDGVRRVDIAASEWTGPKAEAIGWWRSRMPESTHRRSQPAPPGVLVDTLSELVEKPGSESLAYLLALLLVRRRILSEEHIDSSQDEGQVPYHLELTCPADGRTWSVPVMELDPGSLPSLQSQLSDLLFTEA